MVKYKICFADSLPGKPGGGGPDNDFYAEHGFEGSAAKAIKRAEKISWEKYSGDFLWWIVEGENMKIEDVEIEVERASERESPSNLYLPPRMSDELKKSFNVKHHNSIEDLASILTEPSYVAVELFPPGIKNSIDFGYKHWEFHLIYFDLYNLDLLVDRGKEKPGSSGYGKPYNTTCSVYSVEKMIYQLNLARGKEVSHVLRAERYTDYHTKEFVEKYPLKLDVYDFQVNGELMDKYSRQNRNFLKEKEERFIDLCNRLKARGTTL